MCLKTDTISTSFSAEPQLASLMGSYPKGIAPLLNQMLEAKRIAEKDREQLLTLVKKAERLSEFMKVKHLLSLLKEFSDKMVILC